jgi:hypothetical protein
VVEIDYQAQVLKLHDKTKFVYTELEKVFRSSWSTGIQRWTRK